MASPKAMEVLNGRMERPMKDNGSMVRSMALGLGLAEEGTPTLGSGSLVSPMVLESILG